MREPPTYKRGITDMRNCPRCGQGKIALRYNICPNCGYHACEKYIKKDPTWNDVSSGQLSGNNESPEYAK